MGRRLSSSESIISLIDEKSDGEVPAELFPFTTDEGDEGNYDVQKIVVHEGITGLGEKCFANFYSADAVVLPETYSYGDGVKLPDTVERKGYQLVGWEDLADDAGGELIWRIECQMKGNKRVHAVWLDFHVEDLGNGKIRAFWNISPYYECLIRYSLNEDMSDYKFVNKDVQSVTVSKLEKGKRYYIEYAVISDLDDFETLDELPWSGKMSIVVR